MIYVEKRVIVGGEIKDYSAKGRATWVGVDAKQ